MSLGTRQYRYSYTPPEMELEDDLEQDPDNDSALVINVRSVQSDPTQLNFRLILQVSNTVRRVVLVLQTVRSGPSWSRSYHLFHLGEFRSTIYIYYFDSRSANYSG